MIIVIDFGSQTAHLISRRLRQLGVTSEFVAPEDAEATIQKQKPTGIIFSGGPSSVYEDGAPKVSKKILELGLPVLGICYGWQLMAHLLGGEVKSGQKEYGPRKLVLQPAFAQDLNIPAVLSVYMSHGDSVVELPTGFTTLGSTDSVQHALVVNQKQQLFGSLFHPEVAHTEHGQNILEHFAITVCGEEKQLLNLNPEKIVSEVQETVGTAQVICAVSGGVDSTVAAALIAKAIGTQLIPVYVKSGLMRPGTEEAVQAIFTQQIPANLVIVDAQKRFADALKGITDPEEKRKTIGKLYVDIFQEEASKHPEATFLGQGTIYSDVIESKGSKQASKIKSHHNVGGLPKDMKLKLLEPVRSYYKDEVRRIGRKLGLGETTIMQEPFPGPGFGIRVRGEVTPERLEQVKIADAIVLEEIKDAGLHEQLFQCFAVMTGAYSTAVKGDARAFAEVVAIRAYESDDVMTSKWADIPYNVLQKISNRIVNEVPNVSRVVYDITTKPPATMEWE